MEYLFKPLRALAIIVFVTIFIGCSNELNSQLDTLTMGTSEDTIDGYKAIDVASSFFAERASKEHRIVSRVDTKAVPLVDGDGTTFGYLINQAGEGWVIVSATQEFYPILAYSDYTDVEVNSEDLTDKLYIWTEEIAEGIKNRGKLDSLSKSNIEKEWQKYCPQSFSTQQTGIPGGNSPEAVACRNRLKILNETYYNEGWSFQTLSSVSDVALPQRVYDVADQYGSPYTYTIIGIKDVSTYINVQPLISTEWEQSNGYNAMCPDGAVAGCVPIAMAQIMNFHKYPNLFDWNGMNDHMATTASQYLIWQIGKKIDVDYGDEETSASIEDALNGFRGYGYNAILKNHDNLDVIRELSTHGRPIYMRGKRNLIKGHAWVCDGVIRNIAEYEYYVEYLVNNSYNNLGETLIENPGGAGGISYTRFHYNWGWGRDFIGWYIGVNPTDDRNYYIDRQNIYVSVP